MTRILRRTVFPRPGGLGLTEELDDSLPRKRGGEGTILDKARPIQPAEPEGPANLSTQLCPLTGQPFEVDGFSTHSSLVNFKLTGKPVAPAGRVNQRVLVPSSLKVQSRGV